jgi:hypothetical protein
LELFWQHEQKSSSNQKKIENFDDVLKIVAYKIEEAAFERWQQADSLIGTFLVAWTKEQLKPEKDQKLWWCPKDCGIQNLRKRHLREWKNEMAKRAASYRKCLQALVDDTLHTVMRRTLLVSRLITVVPRDLLQPTTTPSHASLEQSKMPFRHKKS